MTRCPKCGNERETDDFYFVKGIRHVWCKPCVREYERVRARLPSRDLKLDVKRCCACGEIKPIEEFHVRWKVSGSRRSECKICCCERVRARRAANPAARAEANRRWNQAHPDQKRAASQAYKARKRGATASEVINRNAVIARDRARCYLCGKACVPGEIELDHVVPLSKGGAHTYGNVAVTCRSCNRRKGAKSPEQFAQVAL